MAGSKRESLKSQRTAEHELTWSQSDDFEPRRIEIDRNIGTDPYQIQERILGDDYQNPITEDTEETGQFCVDMPYVQSRIHSNYDSAESIADSDLEDGELRKILVSPLYAHGRGENYGSSHKPTASGKPEAKTRQKRVASAQRTQADHSRRKLDVKFIPRATSVWETCCSVFHPGATNQVIRIICSVKRDLNL